MSEQTHHDFIISLYEDDPERALFCKVFKQGILGAASGDKQDTYWLFFDPRNTWPGFYFFCDLLSADAETIRHGVKKQRVMRGVPPEWTIARKRKAKIKVDERQLRLAI